MYHDLAKNHSDTLIRPAASNWGGGWGGGRREDRQAGRQAGRQAFPVDGDIPRPATTTTTRCQAPTEIMKGSEAS